MSFLLNCTDPNLAAPLKKTNSIDTTQSVSTEATGGFSSIAHLVQNINARENPSLFKSELKTLITAKREEWMDSQSRSNKRVPTANPHSPQLGSTATNTVLWFNNGHEHVVVNNYQLGVGRVGPVLAGILYRTSTSEAIASVSVKMYHYNQANVKDICQDVSMSYCTVGLPGIVALRGITEFDGGVAIITDRHIRLGKYLKTQAAQNLTLNEQLTLFWSLLQALRALHSSGVQHKDVKIENILLHKDSQALQNLTQGDCLNIWEGWFAGTNQSTDCRSIAPRPGAVALDKSLLLIDFGCSEHYKGAGQPISAMKRGERWASSRWYFPPEFILSTPYMAEKADVWSAGCVLYKLVSNEDPFVRPFEDKKKVGGKGLPPPVWDSRILNGQFHPLPSSISFPPRLELLLKGMFNVDFEERYTLEKVNSEIQQLLQPSTFEGFWNGYWQGGLKNYNARY